MYDVYFLNFTLILLPPFSSPNSSEYIKTKQMTICLFLYSEASCVCLEVELDSDSVISQDLIDVAAKFGIDPNDLGNPIDTRKYVLAFIRKLLLQSRKLNLGIQFECLQPDIVTLWLEVLSMLENSHRKVVGVQSGSLIFTLFCPTTRSMQELRDNSWIKSLTSTMENLVKKIGQCHVEIPRMP